MKESDLITVTSVGEWSTSTSPCHRNEHVIAALLYGELDVSSGMDYQCRAWLCMIWESSCCMRRSVRAFASGEGRGAACACSGERREHSSRQLEPELAIRTIISLCSTWPQSTRSSLQSRPHSSLRYVSQDIGLGLPSFTHSCILPLVHCRGEPGIGIQSRQGPGFGSPQLPLGRRRAERSAEASL